MTVNQDSQTEQISQPAEETVEQTVDTTEATSSDDTTAVDSESQSTTEDHADSDDSESEGKKSGKGFEKRIERFNRRLAEKEAEIEHWRKAALASGGNQSQPQNTPQPQPQSERPKFSDFNDIETYTDAVTEWKLSQREQQQKQQALVQTYAQKEQAIRAKSPDYDEVVSDFKSKYRHVNAPEVNQFIAESDVGPELFYHLANNNAEIDRILALPPLRRVAELGKLEAKISSPAPAKQANQISKAPRPVTKETGTAPSVKRIDDPNISQSDYRQLRMQSRRRY